MSLALGTQYCLKMRCHPEVERQLLGLRTKLGLCCPDRKLQSSSRTNLQEGLLVEDNVTTLVIVGDQCQVCIPPE
jgi:hypothetical protein